MDKYELRRRRLIELRDWECEGKVARLAERLSRTDSYVARMLYEDGKAGKKRIGDDMTDIIEGAFGLPPGWMEMPLGTRPEASPLAPPHRAAEPGARDAASATRPLHALRWPFPTVTYQRVMELKRTLGTKRGAEAMRDIDALLDVAVIKWERTAQTQARRA